MEIQVDDFGRITLRVPVSASETDVIRFFESKKKWAESHSAKLKGNGEPALTEDEVREMFSAAERIIPGRVKLYAEKLRVSYGKITIRNQVTKWGSCSSAGNLSFNCMLALMPEKVLDSVIVHELCHIRYMNHSTGFYKAVRRIMPEYDVWRGWLRENGSAYMCRMRRYREGTPDEKK